MGQMGQSSFMQPGQDENDESLSPNLSQSRGKLFDVLRHSPETAHRIAQTLKDLRNPNDRTYLRRFLGKRLVRGTSILLEEADADSVDLRELETAQREVLRTMEAEGNSAAFLKVFGRKGSLQPVPNPFWRVDREPEEYTRRLGINMEQLLADFASTKGKQLLVEFGPGNGNTRMKRKKNTREAYVDLAICDKLYWPVNTLIERLLDMNKLEERTGPLSPEDKDLLCDFLYKILILQSEQLDQKKPQNDQRVLEDLGRDPRSIVAHLTEKAALLGTIDSVPGNGNASAEGVEYKSRFAKSQDPAFQEACALLSQPGGIDTYVRTSEDVYDLLPAYPAGTIIADFERIDRLQDAQIDVAFGIRSTVYKEGEGYQAFMKTMMQKLAEDGLYIDDNVRENFGWNYRLADLQKIQKSASYPLYVILGPGVDGEDFQEDRPVPLSVVMTRSLEKLSYVQGHLEPGCSLVKLDDLLAKSEYLQTLAEGRTQESLRQLAA